MQGTRRCHGFTLIELIMVIVITGTLAFVALPRLVDTTMWRLRAFSDQLVAELQAAQRQALAQRRPIIATLTPTGLGVAYVSGGSLVTLPCPAAVASCIAESGTRSVTFNASNTGKASTSTSAALTVTVSGGGYSRALTIEHDTGLVH